MAAKEFNPSTYYEEVLNIDLFYEPPDIGLPEQKDKEYPDDDSLGDPGDSDTPMEEDDESDDDDYDRITELGEVDPGDPDKKHPTPGHPPVEDPVINPEFRKRSVEVKNKVATKVDPDMSLKKDSSLPKEVRQAAKQVAGDILREMVCDLYGSPELAHQAFQENPPTSPLMKKAAEWVSRYIGSAHPDEKEQVSMAGMPTGKTVPTTEGPLDKLTFPGKAPAPSFTPPGDKTGTKTGPDATQKLNDDTLFPDGQRPETYKEPGDKTGTPPSKGPANKESDETIFPPQTKAGKRDMTEKVPLGKQGPEYDRHNPDQKNEQKSKKDDKKEDDKKDKLKKEKASHPAPPWELAFTPGLEFLTKAEDITATDPSIEGEPDEDDGHCSKIEKCAREVDLYHRRYAKRGNMKDLQKQADSFKAERDGMDEQKECTKCTDEQKASSKEMFAYSFGQMRRSLKTAMRQFTDAEEVEDVEAYHEIHSMKSDLLGERSQRHFAKACLSMQYARFAAFDDMDEEDKKDSNFVDHEPDDSKDSACKGGIDEEDDMKEEDVKAGFDLAAKLEAAGFISNAKVSDMGMKLAKMDANGRKAFIEMATEMVGEECPPEKEDKKEDDAEFPPAKSAGAGIIERNMVRTGTRQVAGGKTTPSQNAGLMGLFMSGGSAPIFGGK